MSIVGKVFARVLNERVKALTVDKVMDEQGGQVSGLEGDAVTKSLQSSKLWRRPLRLKDIYIRRCI